MASKAEAEKAGNPGYQREHFAKLFEQGFSFSGYERDCLYLSQGGAKYLDVSGISGIDSITDGRAAVFADLDNDGDYDVFLATLQGDGHLLFRNNVGSRNRFIRIALEGVASGKDAYNAVVRVKTSAGILTKLKSGGAGFLSQHDPRLLFGLGADEEAEWVEVAWPSGVKQRFENVPAGTSFHVVEGSPSYRVLQEKRFQLPDPLPQRERIFTKLRIQKGSAFPNVDVTGLSGERRNLSELLPRGRRHLLNLWATWCASCAVEMPELQKLHASFQANNMEIIGLSLDTEGPELVKRFLQQRGIDYPVYLVDESLIERLYATEEVMVPLSLVLDEQGRVTEVFAGWSRETQAELARFARPTQP